MYTQDKVKRLTLRLNTDQYDFLQYSADQLGVTPSEFLRMVINSTMAATRRDKVSKEVKQYEDEQGNLDYIV